MNLNAVIELNAYGTSEGVSKEWDERGRGRKYPKQWKDVGEQQQAVNDAVQRMNVAGDQTVANHFLSRASLLGPVSSPERLAEVESLVQAIAKVDGAPQPGLHHLGEAIQYQNAGGIKGTIAALENADKATPESADIRRQFKHSGTDAALTRAKAVLGAMKGSGASSKQPNMWTPSLSKWSTTSQTA